MFDVDKFKHVLNTAWIGHELIYLNEVDSTNSYLKKWSKKRLCHGVLCLTDHQKSGRGQYKRKWISEPFSNLTFTLAFNPADDKRLHVLSLSCALAISETSESFLGLEAHIKWPNDVISNKAKVAGILTESIFAGNKLDKVLIGIGINVNQTDFPESIRHKATSLRNLSKNENIDREGYLAELLGRVEYLYGLWNKNSTELLKRINRKLIGFGKWRYIKSIAKGDAAGKCKILGINEFGHLVTLSEKDEIKSFTYEQIRISPPAADGGAKSY